MRRAGFSMMELIFVIVILGVLPSVAVPRFVMSRDDACYAKLRAKIAKAQSALSQQYTKNFMLNKAMTKDELEKILKINFGFLERYVEKVKDSNGTFVAEVVKVVNYEAENSSCAISENIVVSEGKCGLEGSINAIIRKEKLPLSAIVVKI